MLTEIKRVNENITVIETYSLKVTNEYLKFFYGNCKEFKVTFQSGLMTITIIH